MAMTERTTSPLLLLVSAPSGAGKTTVSLNLLASEPALTRVITCTTRPARPGERDGVDYHFLDAGEFARRVAAGEFLEHAEVYGNRYGTRKPDVMASLAEGPDVLLSVDVQGAESIRAAAAGDPVLGRALVSVFIVPPSLAELERRLRGRNQDSPETIARRLGMARAEIGHWPHFQYVVSSGTMEEDLAAMRAILAAERLRSGRIRRLGLDQE